MDFRLIGFQYLLKFIVVVEIWLPSIDIFSDIGSTSQNILLNGSRIIILLASHSRNVRGYFREAFFWLPFCTLHWRVCSFLLCRL
jgi:hypothetical protein